MFKRLVCSVIGHKWEPLRVSGEQAYECRRCGRRRFERGRGGRARVDSAIRQIYRVDAGSGVADEESDLVISDLEPLPLKPLDEREDELLVFVGVADEGRSHAGSSGASLAAPVG